MVSAWTWRRMLCVVAFVLVATPAPARSPEIYTGILSSTAVGGYDPVAYFAEGKPVEGKKEIHLRLEGRELALCQRKEPGSLQGQA